MIKNLNSLRSFQVRSLHAWQLLKTAPRTYNELADKLCICRRYAEQVIQHLRASGLIVHSRIECRQRYFWTTGESDFLPAVLTEVEKEEIELVLTGQNLHLQTAFYKLTQLLRH